MTYGHVMSWPDSRNIGYLHSGSFTESDFKIHMTTFMIADKCNAKR